MITRLTAAYPLLPSLLAVKHRSKLLSMSARETTPIAPLMGEDENSIFHVNTTTRDNVTSPWWRVCRAKWFTNTLV